MNRPSAITVASITAVLFAGIACVSVYSYLKKHSGNDFHGVAIATAATDIPIGARLDKNMVKMVDWPKGSLPAGYYANPAALQGRVAVRTMVTGDVFTEQKLMPVHGADTGIMSYIVPQGHRAVTVAVNEVAGVAGFLLPQSRVDVVLTTPRPGTKDKEDNISKVILQDVPILASGQVTEQKEGKPVITPTVTLDLVPADAEKLIVGARTGTLQLLLRNAVDVASVDTKGATIPEALGWQQRAVAPPHPAHRRAARVRTVVKIKEVKEKPAPGYQVEIIKGGNRSKGEFAAEN